MVSPRLDWTTGIPLFQCLQHRDFFVSFILTGLCLSAVSVHGLLQALIESKTALYPSKDRSAHSAETQIILFHLVSRCCQPPRAQRKQSCRNISSYRHCLSWNNKLAQEDASSVYDQLRPSTIDAAKLLRNRAKDSHAERSRRP